MATEHKCGPDGLYGCVNHPRVHVIKRRNPGSWLVMKPGHAGMALIASPDWEKHGDAMNYATDLARILARD